MNNRGCTYVGARYTAVYHADRDPVRLPSPVRGRIL
jgi:hypothetical protein